MNDIVIPVPDTMSTPVADLSDRELLEEIAQNLRVAASAFLAFQSSPASRMMTGMLGGMLTGGNKKV